MYGTSAPRADVTARLASPVPSTFGTPSQRPQGAARSEESVENVGPLAGAGQSSMGPGVSALAAALSNSIGTLPPRFGTPPIRSSSPAGTASGLQPSITPTNYGSFETRSRNLQGGASGAYEDPEIIKRHLVQPTDTADSASNYGDNSKGKQVSDSVGLGRDDEEEFSSLRLQGGDITRQIYKWTEDAEGRNRPQRSKSFSHPRDEPESEVLDINTIKIPGGFRRNYLRRAARSPHLDSDGLEAGEGTSRGRREPQLLTSSFLEFLSIYGHFAGEELEEDDEVLGPGEYFSSGESDDFYDSEEEREPMEDSALLTPSKRKRRRRVRGGSGIIPPSMRLCFS